MLAMQRYKLVHIITEPRSLRFLKGQHAYMRTRGFDIEYISSPGDLLYKYGNQEGVPVHDVRMFRRIRILPDILAVFQLIRKLNKIKPVIVHSHTPKAGLLGMISAFITRIPVRIYHMRGLVSCTAKGGKRLLLRWAEKITCRLAHRVICNSHSLRKFAISEGICIESKIITLAKGSGQGVNASDLFNPDTTNKVARSRIRDSHSIPDEAMVIGFVGRLVIEKGIRELVKAWKILREESPDLYLLLTGPFEELDPLPEALRNSLLDDPRIVLLGLKFDMPPVYALIDILVLPSYREGFSNVLLEAAAMQLPVVASDVPGCKDAVEHNVTGMLVPAQDAKALADALREYIKNPYLRKNHGEAGRSRVLHDFRPESIWSALYHEYKALLKSRRRGDKKGN